MLVDGLGRAKRGRVVVCSLTVVVAVLCLDLQMVFLRQAAAQLLRQRPAINAPVRQVVRRMGGGGHHSPIPHPSQPKQAYLFNEPPGRKSEIWEHITSITYWSAFFILLTGIYSTPETRIKVKLSFRNPHYKFPGHPLPSMSYACCGMYGSSFVFYTGRHSISNTVCGFMSVGESDYTYRCTDTLISSLISLLAIEYSLHYV